MDYIRRAAAPGMRHKPKIRLRKVLGVRTQTGASLDLDNAM